MSKAIIGMLRKNPVLNSLLDDMFVIKIWMRNYRAKPVRDKQLKEAHLVLDKVNKDQNKILFCGVPNHKNMGDQAQRYCIRQWCSNNYPDYDIIEIPTWPFYDKQFCSRIKSLVKASDLFVIQSGYCTTSRHYDHLMHRFIVKSFPDNMILIMPQTVNFIKDRDGMKTAKIYNQHKHLLFLARDQVSYNAAKRYFSETDVRLYPDIVTTLIGTKQIESHREGILICVRNDGEKKYTNEQIESLRKRFVNDGIHCDISDTNSSLPLGELILHFEEELGKTLSYFASHKVVITDRYHGTIFSMISNTPVIVIATLDHKVKTGTEWFRNVYEGSFYNAASLDEANQMARDIIRHGAVIHNAPYFKENYYEKLKHAFDEKE